MENYLVRKHITERQIICPTLLQSHEGKMVLSTEQLAQKLYQYCANGTETVPSYSQKLNS